MNRATISTVKPEHLSGLSQAEAVLFFRDLLWAEARRLGPGTCKIDVPNEINAPDGGIDATVNASLSVPQSEIIEPGKNGYQIKSGSEFKPWQKSQIRKELFGGTRTPMTKENLGPSIRACLEVSDTDAVYVLVCTEINLSRSRTNQARSHIEECLKQCGYQNPKVKVWSQDDLINFLQEFPLLELNLRAFRADNFKIHRDWSKYPDMQVHFEPGRPQSELIEKIQNDLRQDDYPVHVRVWGEPGIGKTRLVLEATAEEDLSPLVIYCRSAVQFKSGGLMNEIRFNENLFAVVVIDECDPSSRFDIWYELQHCSPRIKLITIYNDYEEKSGGITYYDMPSLEPKQISNIMIQEYKIPEDQVDRWAELCGGSPRVAHVIGQNLVNYPEDVLKIPSTVEVDIWERYIAAADQDSEKTEHRRVVLQHLALFKRFGYERSVDFEAQSIAKKVEIANSDITSYKFEEIIYELRERKILQGDSTLYITPKALHIKLWTQWWERHYKGFNLERFTEDLNPKLVEWFYEMFKYAAESDAASKIVKTLLGPDGPFQDDEYLKTRLGSRFFLALTEADPESALRCLMRTLGNWDTETLLQFTSGRRDVVWALEKIAVWRDLFVDAARLLLALGEAENENYSNNASGVFASLFSPGPGRVAPTEVPPAKRLPVLEEAFESNSKERRALALKACNAALESEHFSRGIGAEYQGLRNPPKLWEPKTYDELWDTYRQVWQLLSGQLPRLPQDECKEAVEILFERAGALAKIPDLSDMVIDTVITIVHERYVSQKQVIETISQILYYDDTYDDDLPVEIRQRFEQLRDELVGSDFHSLMQRYVGMDLLEDQLEANKDEKNQVQPHLEKLARQAFEDPTLLQAELPWLVTTEAKNGYKFGYELGKRDNHFSLLPTLLDAQRNAIDNASVYFLGGYFRTIFENDLAEWEKQLDVLVEDTTLNVVISDLTHRSGLTDRAGLRLLNLAQSGVIGINHFGIFVYGKAIESLSEAVFTAWIEFLLSFMDKSAMSIALILYHRYYGPQRSKLVLPCDLTFQLLTHPLLFEESEKKLFNPMTDYHWTEIGKVFVQSYPEKNLELLKIMLAHFGQKGSIVDNYSKTCSVLTELTRQHPIQVWKHVSEYLDARDHFLRTFALEKWLREADISATEKEKGALTLIPSREIWKWIDANVKDRSQYVARSLVPKTRLVEEWPTSLAREILVRYGKRKKVRQGLISNYSTGVWVGPESLRYERKKQQLLHIKNSEDNKNVQLWIDDFVEVLDKEVERAKVEEEREF